MHKFELAGYLAGKTVNLGGYSFVDGVYTHDTEDQTIEGLTTYLERSYYAFPAGSQALKDANERYEREQASGEGEVAAPKTDEGEGADNATVKDAIDALDPEDDTHWTAAGLPSTDAVSDLAGAKVSRAAIETAAPGYNRASAKTAASI